MEKIQIKCPVCGALLEAFDDPANYTKNVTCPNCKHKGKFTSFLQPKVCPVAARPVNDDTVVSLSRKGSIGYLLDKITGQFYPLKEGRQIIGRKTTRTPSKADVPISTNDQGMSREHLCIDVILGNDAQYHVYASNAKNQNPTTINGKLLEANDKVGVKHGDIIRLCETPLQYVGTPINDSTII